MRLSEIYHGPRDLESIKKFINVIQSMDIEDFISKYGFSDFDALNIFNYDVDALSKKLLFVINSPVDLYDKLCDDSGEQIMKVYHTSPITNSFNILKDGLVPKMLSWGNETNSDYNRQLTKPAIFVKIGFTPEDAYYSEHDDIYEIDIKKLPNKWFIDSYAPDSYLTYEKIPLKAIKLIYKGTGK